MSKHKTIENIVKAGLIGIAVAGFTTGGYILGNIKNVQSYVCLKDKIKYDDGDSFYCSDEYIRILGIDTPEIIHEKHDIYENHPYGEEAAALANKLMDEAKRVRIVKVARDKYDRTLAHVLLDGELLAVKMIKAGLAYETIEQYGDNGFPEFALSIQEAAETAPVPKFEKPSIWRNKYQRKVNP